jgi:23S rRNA (guanosine2251-2'-O)-methyltransferase
MKSLQEKGAQQRNMNGKKEMSDNIIVGRNAVLELLKTGRDIDKIFIKDGEWEGSIKKIVAEARERGIPTVKAGRAKLDQMADGLNHQGVIAFAAEVQYCDIKDILAKAKEKGEAPFIVIADGINDPHNLGALIRVAEGAGCHGLIIPKRHSATLTSTVAKASAGAIEHLPIAKVSNISNAIEELKKAGLWIYAAEAGGQEYDKTEIITPAAFVLGSEGEGVSRIVKEKSDFILSIEMKGKVNSLNVSSAAAVILFHARKFFS